MENDEKRVQRYFNFDISKFLYNPCSIINTNIYVK